jgi:hypothetical protein
MPKGWLDAITSGCCHRSRQSGRRGTSKHPAGLTPGRRHLYAQGWQRRYTASVKAAKAEAREAQDAAEALRQADVARRGRGRLARLRAAWRGERCRQDRRPRAGRTTRKGQRNRRGRKSQHCWAVPTNTEVPAHLRDADALANCLHDGGMRTGDCTASAAGDSEKFVVGQFNRRKNHRVLGH